MGQLTSVLFIVVMFAFLYFFMIRPQRKQQQQHQQMLSKIKRGDKVATIGRLHGVVDEVNEADKTVTLDCDGIFLVFDLSAIAKIAPNEADIAATAAPKADAEVATSAESHIDSAASNVDSAATSADSAADDSEAK
ncbi:preprotein translocase subunit YajC [Lactobacillus sp. CBA3605]|uniref:preprotein translocase subunit YajC n=1 Tax=Lactobacillus sp. CBA3605 TaxID=2099788 RepID=UPI000CFC6DBD|nr:preprotein translocase subunit YajC [Lactobacillus sp. CBA3605]AVK60743.1 preprotein translocase subunit YajC [Lactobacillus sp. CBA3605]